MAFELTSPAFEHSKPIPAKYTGDGEDVSPPLEWSGAPEGTVEFALISDDPDAPGMTWVHWVIYGIPASNTGLPEAVPKTGSLADGARQGMTDFGSTGYGGPAPPPGKDHRYFFKLYALDIKLDLGPGATKATLLAAMEGDVLDETQLMGTYRR
jgi:Raf kinase inhibitor-like YbhB/YbcL family protein